MRDLPVEVRPIRVLFLDQPDFPRPIPPFELLLARDCDIYIFVRFEPDQPVNAIFLGEALHNIVRMLPRAMKHIIRHTDVECAVSPAR